MRVFMIVDILPVKAIQKRYHAWKEWPQQMKQLTKGLPIVFSNSYQRASKYWFYSGQMTYSQNDVAEHRNNYNFWPIEGEMIGKPVYFLDIYRLNRFTDSLKTPIGYVGYRYDSSFISFASYNISTGNRYKAINQNDSLVLYCSNYMNRYHNLYIKKNPGTLYSSTLIFFEQGKIIKTIPFSLQLEKMGTKNPEPFSVYPDLPKGKYHFIISIKVPGYNATHNSENIELIVE